MLVDKVPEGFKKSAQEGATCDGRIMKREWIEQCDNNYDPKKYGARVWYEHYRWAGAFGDILETCRTEEAGKLCLYTKIKPLPELIKLNQAKQKVYPSLEINPNFADTGEAYLVGLGVTDSPASLGTEMLQFSSNAASHPLDSRKQSPDNIFTATMPELAMDFSEFQPEAAAAVDLPQIDQPQTAREKGIINAFTSAIANLFTQSPTNQPASIDMDKPATTETTQVENHSAPIATEAAGTVSLEAFSELKKSLETLAAENKTLTESFNSMKAELEKNQAPDRELSTGGTGEEKFNTDC